MIGGRVNPHPKSFQKQSKSKWTIRQIRHWDRMTYENSVSSLQEIVYKALASRFIECLRRRKFLTDGKYPMMLTMEEDGVEDVGNSRPTVLRSPIYEICVPFIRSGHKFKLDQNWAELQVDTARASSALDYI
ncbi:hypothetical protein AB6A40_005461 [Gnathostoma spinigerum]|uniref:Uncharacterized protein n=1 Tax=Gnathostoma spinigerum TaxID=75299 RepID=A0ABD6EPZ6_9BILA